MAFAVHTLFATSTPWVRGPLRLDLPQLDSVRPVAALLAAVAFALVFVLRWSVLRTLACAPRSVSPPGCR